jgi:hypothetical protein
MNFTGSNGQRTGPVKHVYRRRKIVVRAQIPMELRTVCLFNDEDTAGPFESGG